MRHLISMLCGVLLALGSVAFTTNDVAACGAPFFPDDYEFSVESRGQVALLHFRADRIDIHTPLLVKTEEGATQDLDALAWVFPVPVGTELALGDASLFDALDADTRVTVTIDDQTPEDYGSSSGGIGCGSAADGAAGGYDGTPNDRATAIETGRIGDYEYAILEASTPADVIAWLEMNEFATIPGLDASLSGYLSAGMQIAAVKVASDALSEQEGIDLAPLVISTPRPQQDESFVYPLMLSKLAAPDVSDITFYIAASSPGYVGSYERATIEDMADALLEDHLAYEFTTYDGVIDNETREASGNRLFITEGVYKLADTYSAEFAELKSLDEAPEYLTRVRGRVPREALVDASFAFDDPAGVEPFDGQVTRSYNRAEGEEEEGGCMTMPVGLLQHPLALFAGIALLFGLRRRERR